jgi:hypothetical protein
VIARRPKALANPFGLGEVDPDVTLTGGPAAAPLTPQAEADHVGWGIDHFLEEVGAGGLDMVIS